MFRTKIGPIAIILATIVVLGVSIYAVLIAVARTGDARQREIEQTIVHSALGEIREKLSDAMVQDAYWDTAYDRIGRSVDKGWAEQQLSPTSVGAGVSITLVANARAEPMYSFGSKTAPVDVAGVNAAATLRSLIRRALAAPALPPVAFTGFVGAHDRLYVAAAQRIVPNDARARGPLTHHFALAYLVPFDASQLGRLQSQFHIAAMRVGAQPKRGLASVPLRDASGNAVAYLIWHAERPGEAFANAAAPFAFASFAIVGLLQLVVLRSWMRAAQRMRDEGAAKAMFLANVSHELRTPLNAIIGFSECMVSELLGPLNPRYKGYANDISMSGLHLLGIVNDVLDLTQLHSSETIALEPLPISTAMHRPLLMLREYARSEDIAIDFVDFSEGAQIIANEKAVSQMILNLGSNAVKFSPRKATVEVILRPAAREDFVELVVRDRGIGIAEDKLRLIGQPFFQAHNGRGRKPGSGLGLAIVKSLAERLGGELTIESALGSGTTAIVRLPLHRQHAWIIPTKDAA